MLPVESKELFLVLVGDDAHIDVSMLPLAIKSEPASILTHQIGPCGELDVVVVQSVVLARLLIVVHLDLRMVLFDRGGRS